MDPAKDGEPEPISIEPDPVGAALQMAGSYAAVAMGRRDAVLDALARAHGETLAPARLAAEAGLAVVALYISLAAVRRYSTLTGAPGPLMASMLDPLLDNLEHMRDTVMHWEGKADRVPGSFLLVDTKRVFIVAGHKQKGPPRRATVTWKNFGDSASRVEAWTRFLLDHPEERGLPASGS
jgi:hypothetical protein